MYEDLINFNRAWKCDLSSVRMTCSLIYARSNAIGSLSNEGFNNNVLATESITQKLQITNSQTCVKVYQASKFYSTFLQHYKLIYVLFLQVHKECDIYTRICILFGKPYFWYIFSCAFPIVNIMFLHYIEKFLF